MTPQTKEIDWNLVEIHKVLLEIRDLLKPTKQNDLATYAKVQQRMKDAETDLHKRFDELVKEDIFSTVQANPPEPPYDWWQLANGQYAKVVRTQLQGTVYTEKGEMITDIHPSWNPLSMRSNNRQEFDLMKRKSGNNPSGWPEWTK